MPLTSFYTALTGLDNNALAINVIGNNLANINTTAFKASKSSFAELLGGLASTSAGTGNPIQVGLGSYTQGITPVFNQGSIASTGRSTDAAIGGNGFFVVDTNGGLGFTRAGSFGFTSEGEIVNSEGFKLMGYAAVNGVVNSGGVLGPITIQKGGSLPPNATTKISVGANLDSSAITGTTFSSAVQVYDSLGTKLPVSITYTKTDAGWDWSATIPAVATGGLPTDSPVEIGNGALVFDANGIMTAPTVNATLSVTGLASGAADQNITLNFLDDSGKPLYTSYSAASGVSSTTQDGYAASVLRDVSIDSNGVISGLYDNGQVQPLAQMAIANFPNVEGLLKFAGSTFVAFGNSGEPSIGVAGTGGRGLITGSALEQSNVDIATEFTNLIIAQRGYQANSKVITTTDELYQDAINLIR
jgi:flagellar hook protein FlgE